MQIANKFPSRLCLLLTLLFSISTFGFANIENDPEPLSKEDKAKLEKIENRVLIIADEIKDLKVLKKEANNRIEKKEIRKKMKELKSELNAMEAEAKAVSGGLYIGSGALIVILLLLLLL